MGSLWKYAFCTSNVFSIFTDLYWMRFKPVGNFVCSFAIQTSSVLSLMSTSLVVWATMVAVTSFGV